MREGPSQRGHQRVFAAEKCFMPAAPHYRSRGEEACERSTPTQKGFAVKQPLLTQLSGTSYHTADALPLLQGMQELLAAMIIP